VEEAADRRPEADQRPATGELAGRVLRTGNPRGNCIRHSRKGRGGACSGEGPTSGGGPSPPRRPERRGGGHGPPRPCHQRLRTCRGDSGGGWEGVGRGQGARPRTAAAAAAGEAATAGLPGEAAPAQEERGGKVEGDRGGCSPAMGGSLACRGARLLGWLEARPGAQGLLAAAAWRAGAGPGNCAGSWRRRPGAQGQGPAAALGARRGRSRRRRLEKPGGGLARIPGRRPGAAWRAGLLAAATWRAGAGPGGGAGGAQGQIPAAAAGETLAAAARRLEES
jgi:hypothetical protein